MTALQSPWTASRRSSFVKMVDNGKTEQRVADNRRVEIPFDQIADVVEGELFVVDSQYRVRYVNSAMRQRLVKDGQPLEDKYCYEVCEGRSSPCHQRPLEEY